MMKCSECVYYQPSTTRADGQCRRNPPVVLVNLTRDVWPAVSEDSWCGEFRAPITQGPHD